MPTQLGPKGDMRYRGVLSAVVNLPEMHIPPWYWFRIGRAGVDLEAHAEFRYLQAFYELGVKPPAHAEAADIIIGIFGSEGEQQ